jgi:hypothetical protein
MRIRTGACLLAAIVTASALLLSGEAAADQSYTVRNELVECTVSIADGVLASDKLETTKQWQKSFGGRPASLETDADFRIDVMWTGWRYPGHNNNADNFVELSKNDFAFTSHEEQKTAGGGEELHLYFEGNRNKLILRVTYSLGPDDFYIRRSLALADTINDTHFLHAMSPRAGLVSGARKITKPGEFGQPVALALENGGAFLGLEYPTAVNGAESEPGGQIRIECAQEIGRKIGPDWTESDPVVTAVTPNQYIRFWFMEYVDDIRVAPLAPYALYNSWYDLRSPEYPRVPEGNVMSEKTVFHMIDLVRQNIIEKHHIKLDAFVLDDGWDVYDSDWRLRTKQFPRGMKPIADELRKTDTDLGIWFGPTGGYSFRLRRINWMKEHGYETLGEETEYNTAMLCIAGENYSKLFKKRVVDFVENDGIGYFKWDGFQFSCSEPGHGHPVGPYSRRAVMETVVELCKAVRKNNPGVFLNITSGTWLSPWWTKYANTIWMDGSDYGYADVPSISKRDAAITYRDFVLYDDFKTKDLWFPIANLMTHGIIKGNLQRLGGEAEPLDKFTDNALLYFARGVSMWELYISPDILTDDEWDAIGESMAWAKDRFPILKTTNMIGGDPTRREPYGYTHFKDTRGIVAVRNPFITDNAITVELAPSQGLDPKAAALVLERVYPTRWISPRLYRAGTAVELSLGGYETAIYEVYPLEEATEPLLAGVVFDATGAGGRYEVQVYETTGKVKLLNPESVDSMKRVGADKALKAKDIRPPDPPAPVANVAIETPGAGGEFIVEFSSHETVGSADLSILVKPDEDAKGAGLPDIGVTLDGSAAEVRKVAQKGMWAWYTIAVEPGVHVAKVTAILPEGVDTWTGSASIWYVGLQRHEADVIEIETDGSFEPKILPPHPWAPGSMRKNIHLGNAKITL